MSIRNAPIFKIERGHLKTSYMKILEDAVAANNGKAPFIRVIISILIRILLFF
jgi:hypothetical protein